MIIEFRIWCLMRLIVCYLQRWKPKLEPYVHCIVGSRANISQIVSLANVCVRQTVLFSATMPPSVERLVRSSVLNPIYVRVGSVDTPAETIQQDIIFVQSREKKVCSLRINLMKDLIVSFSISY